MILYFSTGFLKYKNMALLGLPKVRFSSAFYLPRAYVTSRLDSVTMKSLNIWELAIPLNNEDSAYALTMGSIIW